jgi:hypothetical protein
VASATGNGILGTHGRRAGNAADAARNFPTAAAVGSNERECEQAIGKREDDLATLVRKTHGINGKPDGG